MEFPIHMAVIENVVYPPNWKFLKENDESMRINDSVADAYRGAPYSQLIV